MPRQLKWASSPAQAMAIFLVSCALLGALLAPVWHVLAPSPTYVVGADGSATIKERALTEFFATDAWYTVLGLVAGIVVGLVAWLVFRDLGWPVIMLAIVGASVAGLACWLLGTVIGPMNFAARVAAAQPGEHVPIDFALRSTTALIVWPFAALAPVLFGAAFAREEAKDAITGRA